MQSFRKIAFSLTFVVAAGCGGGSSGGPQGSGGATGSGGTTGAGGTSTGGATGSGGVTGTGGTASGGDGPIILSLATNVTTLIPGGTLVVTAVVTHPQGIAQVIGGTLNDPSGSSYGAFMVSTTSGSYSFTLSWTALNMLQEVNTAAGGSSRSFQVTFYDQAGHSTSRTFTIQFVCETATDAICQGFCAVLAGDRNNCGVCGHDCERLYTPKLSGDAFCEQSKCIGGKNTTSAVSCNSECQAAGLSCKGGTATYSTSNATNINMNIDCATVPAATITSQSRTFYLSFLSCSCTE